MHALLFGVILALGLLGLRTSQSRLSVLGREPNRLVLSSMQNHPDNIIWPGVLIVRPDHELFFANCAGIRQEINQLVIISDPSLTWVVRDLEMTGALDVDSLDILEKLYTELSACDVNLTLIRVHTPVQEILARSRVAEKIGWENIHSGGIFSAASTYANDRLACFDIFDAESIMAGLEQTRDLYLEAIKVASEMDQTELKRHIELLETIIQEDKKPRKS